MPKLNGNLIRAILENEGLTREDLQSICEVKLRTIDKALAKENVSAFTHSELSRALRIDPPLLLLTRHVRFSDLCRDDNGIYRISGLDDNSENSQIPEQQSVQAELVELGDVMGLLVSDESFCNPDQAVAKAEKLVKDNPSADNHNLAGIVLATAGLHRRAQEEFKLATAIDACHPLAWLNLAHNYQIFGDMKNAERAFLKALEAKGDYAWLNHIASVETTPRAKKAAERLLAQYNRRLAERTATVEAVICQLEEPKSHKSGKQKKDELNFDVTGHEKNHGKNATRFVIHTTFGNTVVLCLGEDEEAAVVVMPFRVPDGVEFEKSKLRFIDYFGYEQLIDSEQPDDEQLDDPVLFFAGKLRYDRVDARSLNAWLLRSVLFQQQGEAFLKGEPFWEVSIDE